MSKKVEQAVRTARERSEALDEIENLLALALRRTKESLRRYTDRPFRGEMEAALRSLADLKYGPRKSTDSARAP